MMKFFKVGEDVTTHLLTQKLNEILLIFKDPFEKQLWYMTH